jgi:hypothetical protein
VLDMLGAQKTPHKWCSTSVAVPRIFWFPYLWDEYFWSKEFLCIATNIHEAKKMVKANIESSVVDFKLRQAMLEVLERAEPIVMDIKTDTCYSEETSR